LVHAPLHAVSGEPQLAEHVPFMQTLPEPHAVPQLPQFAGSAIVFEQRLPQSV
jgi:hypothetical protein